MIGWIVVYVDGVAIIADDPAIDLVRDKIAQKWRITDKPTVSFGSGRTVEYLSVDIRALSDGCPLPGYLHGGHV